MKIVIVGGVAASAEPIIPSTEGVTLPGIFTVRTPKDAIQARTYADTVTRLGFDYVKDHLLYGEIKKEEILEKKVKGGAAC